MFLLYFSVQQTTYRIGNHEYYWVWLRPDRLNVKKTTTATTMYSSGTFYAQNPALEIVDQQEKRECLSTHTCTKRMFSRTSPLCAASCVTKIISPRFSPAIFYRDANSALLRAHLCTAVLMGSMRRTLCSKLFIKRA